MTLIIKYGQVTFLIHLILAQPVYFLWFLCVWFSPLTFDLFVTLDLKCVSGSCCDSVVKEPKDRASIPGPAQWVKDPALL